MPFQQTQVVIVPPCVHTLVLSHQGFGALTFANYLNQTVFFCTASPFENHATTFSKVDFELKSGIERK